VTLDETTYNYLNHLLLIKTKADEATKIYKNYRSQLNPKYDIIQIRALDEQYDMINDWFNTLIKSAIYIDNTISEFIYNTQGEMKTFKHNNKNEED
jgi:hypothetical protein